MKEHRSKALRVTTPNSVNDCGDCIVGTQHQEDIIFPSDENAAADSALSEAKILRANNDTSCSSGLGLQQKRRASTSSGEDECCSSASSSSCKGEEAVRKAAVAIDDIEEPVESAKMTAAPVTASTTIFANRYHWFSAYDDRGESRRSLKDLCICANSGLSAHNCRCRPFHKRKQRQKCDTATNTINTTISISSKFPILDAIIEGNGGETRRLNPKALQLIRRDRNVVIEGAAWYMAKDANGNNALLVSGQKLLKEGKYEEATQLVQWLLEEGSDVNALNNENRTILSYSVQHMDRSLQLTRLLLNYGASVWPMPASRNASENSCNGAFTWFLLSIIRQLRMNDNCRKTLFVLSEVMGENPKLMHSHVMSTMFSNARCYNILGQVFLQIKLAMCARWTGPQSLKYLSRAVVRKTILSKPGRFINQQTVSTLPLPPKMQEYVMLEF